MAVSATLQARLLIHTNLRCDDRGRVVECIDCSPLATGQTDEALYSFVVLFQLSGPFDRQRRLPALGILLPIRDHGGFRGRFGRRLTHSAGHTPVRFPPSGHARIVSALGDFTGSTLGRSPIKSIPPLGRILAAAARTAAPRGAGGRRTGTAGYWHAGHPARRTRERCRRGA